MKTPHKHAEIIKAWADGEQIEVRHKSEHKWESLATAYEGLQSPAWYEQSEYRIKPEPKPDVVQFGVAMLEGFGSKVWYLGSRNGCPDNNIKLTFDGETGKLKSAEVLK